MHSPGLLPSLSPLLSESLKSRTDEVRCKIIRANFNTQFAQGAPELAEFRDATADGYDDNSTLADTFRKTVPFTSYDSYAPFVARFFEKPCKANAVVNLLAPGLPDFLVESTSTSGGSPKTFPVYSCLRRDLSSNVESLQISDPVRRRTTAQIWCLYCHRMDVEDEDNFIVSTMHLTSRSAESRRTALNLDPEKDGEKMGTFMLDHAAPYAAGFVKKWRSFLLIHALFAVGSRPLETMAMVVVNTFVDFMRHLDAEFDMIVDCIEQGTIPDLEGTEHVRHYLEPNISPDPKRAEELRSIGRPSSRPGWCSHVWPSLRSITCIASGAFASSLPLAQWYLGPVDIRAHRYGSSEAIIALPYDPLVLNQYKPNGAIIIEFLDFYKSESICALAQPWEVEVGKSYEVVLTTPDGLWRYRLGDVMEIAGFDPADGTPIMRFVERRNVIIRFPNFMVTENELRSAMSSIPRVSVVDWTATIDNRDVLPAIGFFLELATNDQVSELRAADHVLNTLSQLNAKFASAFALGRFRKPTIRLVLPGTFSAFRQLRLDEGTNNLGQIKIPVVLPKPAYITWFSDRVVKEL